MNATLEAPSKEKLVNGMFTKIHGKFYKKNQDRLFRIADLLWPVVEAHIPDDVKDFNFYFDIEWFSAERGYAICINASYENEYMNYSIDQHDWVFINGNKHNIIRDIKNTCKGLQEACKRELEEAEAEADHVRYLQWRSRMW